MSFLYLALGRVLELLLLLGRSRDQKELEILVLRHELRVMRRTSGRPRYVSRDRALLAAVSRVLSRDRWSAFTVTPETLLRWHRRMIRRRWTYGHRAPGRPRLNPDLVGLIVRLARENAGWGSRRIVGELKKLGFSVSETSVRNPQARGDLPPRAEAVLRGGRSSGSRRRQ